MNNELIIIFRIYFQTTYLLLVILLIELINSNQLIRLIENPKNVK